MTGCNLEEILIASHIVPWKDCTDEERLDVDNGLLLSPNYDALFDKHLISFDEDGKLIGSNTIIRDISSLKILNEVATARKELEEKDIQKEKFVAMLTHDLKNFLFCMSFSSNSFRAC